jgi:hypothetical protein
MTERTRETTDAIFLTELQEKLGTGPAAELLGISPSALAKNVKAGRCSRPIELAAQFLLSSSSIPRYYLCIIPEEGKETLLSILNRFHVSYKEIA